MCYLEFPPPDHKDLKPEWVDGKKKKWSVSLSGFTWTCDEETGHLTLGLGVTGKKSKSRPIRVTVVRGGSDTHLNLDTDLIRASLQRIRHVPLSRPIDEPDEPVENDKRPWVWRGSIAYLAKPFMSIDVLFPEQFDVSGEVQNICENNDTGNFQVQVTRPHFVRVRPPRRKARR